MPKQKKGNFTPQRLYELDPIFFLNLYTCQKGQMRATSIPMISPIYHASGLDSHRRICAAFTGDGGDHSDYFAQNLKCLATQLGFDSRRLTWPNGGWPHSGHAILAEDFEWISNKRTGGIMPVERSSSSSEPKAVTYDGVVTRSPQFVLGVQGADCPSIFLYAPESGVDWASPHAGWNRCRRVIQYRSLHVACGADRNDISAYIGPGIGDRYTQFHWDDEMEPHIRDVFIQAGREDLLNDSIVRHEMTESDRQELALALGKEVPPGTSFKLSTLAVCELERNGVNHQKITESGGSTIVDRHPSTDMEPKGAFRYQSYRREWPKHGLSMSVLFLKTGSQTELVNGERKADL
ncbi:hypothetical protein CPSG_03681 [Coccidioides posadasii str. Silveira]|uniref:Uncharacterized protein n=1 Tax=Coccidioides posadasii (strain RMSCC 757 / Silveira) TaxID=443226 RepID=E9D283_COCPS|nr:hypothetical protein CPSG_03681 [Coccidioides posadasii str. Silveira]